MIHTNYESRMDFQELVTELARRRETAVDLIAHANKVNFAVDDDAVIIETDQVSGDITNHALGQMATHTKIGTRYARLLNEVDPGLLAHNLNVRNNSVGGSRMYRFLDDTARGSMSASYRRIDDMVMMKGAWLSLEGNTGWRLHEAAFTEKRMHMRMVLPLVTADVKLNDPVSLGLRITNSEVGAGAACVALEVMRLACLNGMVIPQAGLRKVHLGARNDDALVQLSEKTLNAGDKAIMLEIADTISCLADKDRFQSIVDELSGTADVGLNDPAASLKVLAKTGGLTDDEEKAMMNSFINGGDSSLWGLINAATDTARDMPNYDRKIQIEEMAGEIAMGGRAKWDNIVHARA